MEEATWITLYDVSRDGLEGLASRVTVGLIRDSSQGRLRPYRLVDQFLELFDNARVRGVYLPHGVEHDRRGIAAQEFLNDGVKRSPLVARSNGLGGEARNVIVGAFLK